MEKLRRLWKALEDRPPLRGVRREIQEILGDEFDIAARFLLRTGAKATRYPCPSPSHDGCPRNVLTELNGLVRAICGASHVECDEFRLRVQDIEILGFDSASFAGRLRAVFDLSEMGTSSVADTEIIPVGIRKRAGERAPVVLLMPSSFESADALIAEAERTFRQGAILLTPTDQFISPATEGRLIGSRLAWRTLSDVILADQSKLVANPQFEGLNDHVRPVRPVPSDAENVFQRQGENWVLSFAGKQAQFGNSVGFGYLATLLRSPGKEIEALVLAGADESEALIDVGPAIELADDKAIRQAEQQLADDKISLAQLSPNNWVQRGELQVRIAKLESYLHEAKGYAGKIRMIGGQAEKARKTVSIAISRTIKKIQDYHPDLAHHLDEAIQKGKALAYRPKTPVDWLL